MGAMTRCMYGECGEAVEGSFYLAPGSQQSHPWPVSVPYLTEPVPLCHWHGLLVGDQLVSKTTHVHAHRQAG